MQKLPDGRIVFPHRGMPPLVLPGYEPEPGDPYVFVPVLAKCQHRTALDVRKPGCKQATIKQYCKKFEFFVSTDYCQNCRAEDK